MKKVTLLLCLVFMATMFTGCNKNNENPNAVAYSFGAMSDSYDGEQKAIVLVDKFLIDNDLQLMGIPYDTNKDTEMIAHYNKCYEKLQKAINDGVITKILKDSGLIGGKVVFDYVLLSSLRGELVNNRIEVSY